MKNYFTKAVVAVGVMASAVALSSMAVMANPDITATTEYAPITSDSTGYAYTYTIPSVSSSSFVTVTASDNIHEASFNVTSGTTTGGYQKANANKDDVVKGVEANQPVVFNIYNKNNSAVDFCVNVGSTADKESNTRTVFQMAATTSYEITVTPDAAGDLYFYFGSQVGLGNIGVVQVSGTAYDTSKFAAATTDHTASIADTTAAPSSELTYASYVEALAANVDTSAATATNPVDVNVEATVGGFKVVAADSRAMKVTDTVIRSAGSTNANGRYIEFSANKGDVIKMTGVVSSSTESDKIARTMHIRSGSATGTSVFEYTTVAGGADVTYPIAANGTYYVTFDASIDFTGIAKYAGQTVTAPYLTLAPDTTSFTDDATSTYYVGTINSDADESLKVKSVEVNYAQGYDAQGTAIAAKTVAVSTLYEEDGKYMFWVKMESVPTEGVEMQGHLVYDNNGTSCDSYTDKITVANA